MKVRRSSSCRRSHSARSSRRSLASRLDSGSSSRKVDGIGDQRARQRDALRLAAGALARHLVEQMRDAHHLGHLAHALGALLRRHVLHAQAELDVLRHGLVRKQRVALEHHAEPAVARLEVVDHAAVDPDLARGRILEAGDHAQRRGLAAAGGADEHDELAVLDREVDVLDGDHGRRTTCADCASSMRATAISAPCRS